LLELVLNSVLNNTEEVKKMTPKHPRVKLICAIVALFFCLQLASCGFVLYPERRGQTHGRIDPAVAVLDGVGLLLFLVPGIVAFAVDFATGTIYLPSSKRASTNPSDKDELLVIHVNPNELNSQKIEAIVTDHTGYPVKFDQDNLRAFELDRAINIEAEILRLAQSWKHVPIEDMIAHQKSF
jgi:hypothetical protein